MNNVNSIMASALALLLAASALLVIAAAAGGVNTDDLSALKDIHHGLGHLQTLDTASFVAVLVGAIVVLSLSFLVLVLQFTNRAQLCYLIEEGEMGTLTIHRASISALTRHAGSAVVGVEEVYSSSRQNQLGHLELSCHLVIRPPEDVTRAGREFQEAVKAEIEEKTGLKVSKIDISARYRSTNKKERRRMVT